MSIRILSAIIAMNLVAAVASATTYTVPSKNPEELGLSKVSIAGNAGGQISCEESTIDENTGNDINLAKITIDFGVDGKASRVQIVRPKTKQISALNLTFTKANAVKFTHTVDEGTLESGEGEPKQYSFNISEVETIHVESKKTSMTLALFDHLYAGIPGSTLAISQGDTLDIGGNSGDAMVICKWTKKPVGLNK